MKEMYEELFENFKKQMGIFTTIVNEMLEGKVVLPIEIIEEMRKSLLNGLNILEGFLSNLNNQDFVNFYMPRCKHYAQYMKDISAAYNRIGTKK